MTPRRQLPRASRDCPQDFSAILAATIIPMINMTIMKNDNKVHNILSLSGLPSHYTLDGGTKTPNS